MNRKIRILVVTYHPWREDISSGNTLSNIFNGMEDKLEFANIFIRDDKPCNQIVSRFFNISEKGLAKSIICRHFVGKEVDAVGEDEEKENFSVSYNAARRMRWDILLLAQDLIGLWGCWKSKGLDRFVDDFNPDLIFGPLGRMPVGNNIMTYLSQKHNVPLVTYPWDDHYSLHKHSWSPIFWIKLFVERKAIWKCALQSKYLYCITSLMQQEYSEYFNKECRLLYKGFDFENKPVINKPDGVLKIVYMGNIGSGRWKVLSKVAEAINEINCEKKRIELYIYTLSPKSKEMECRLNEGDSHLMSPVPESQKMQVLKEANVLLHVEPTTTKDRLMFRLSFSTKLVDYLYNAKCIFALGGHSASMQYLQENDAGIVELNDDKIKEKLLYILGNPNIITEYSEKAWRCGMRNHKISTIQDKIYNDFKNVIDKYADE